MVFFVTEREFSYKSMFVVQDYVGTRGRKHGEITRYVKHVEARKEIIRTRTRNRRPGKKIHGAEHQGGGEGGGDLD